MYTFKNFDILYQIRNDLMICVIGNRSDRSYCMAQIKNMTKSTTGDQGLLQSNDNEPRSNSFSVTAADLASTHDTSSIAAITKQESMINDINGNKDTKSGISSIHISSYPKSVDSQSRNDSVKRRVDAKSNKKISVIENSESDTEVKFKIGLKKATRVLGERRQSRSGSISGNGAAEVLLCCGQDVCNYELPNTVYLHAHLNTKGEYISTYMNNIETDYSRDRS